MILEGFECALSVRDGDARASKLYVARSETAVVVDKDGRFVWDGGGARDGGVECSSWPARRFFAASASAVCATACASRTVPPNSTILKASNWRAPGSDSMERAS